MNWPWSWSSCCISMLSEDLKINWNDSIQFCVEQASVSTLTALPNLLRCHLWKSVQYWYYWFWTALHGAHVTAGSVYLIWHLLEKTQQPRTSVRVTLPRMSRYPVCESVSEPLVVCWSMTTQMKRSICPQQTVYAVDIVALGTTKGTAYEDEESSSVRRNILSVHLATGSTEFRPIFQPGTWESMGCCYLLPIYKFGQLHKWKSMDYMD